MRARLAAVLVAAGVASALALPGAAVGQPPPNPLAPGLPQPSVSVPTTTAPVVVPTTGSTSSSGGLSGGDALAVAIGALVVLGGISFFIWHDARRRAPVRHRAAAATPDTPGSKRPPKARKLSPAERRRRKRGKAR